uniref:Uncharacterized protein LOC111102104 n=1 Tax=Crassostrea virginica TaxID=6565 RepID=A0A8B8AKA7_CRAVI|nr:uncharacterized protein LOC111102104 [Crassostrea virginica]
MFPVFCLLVCILSSSTERIGGVKPHFCDNGYSGLFCKNKCQYPFYGKQCHEKCFCNRDLCNFIHGCRALNSCPNGYTGTLCSETCTFPQYGQACQKRCLCPEQRCHFAKGCTNAEKYSVVREETELKSNSLTGTSVSSGEHSKTTKTYDQTHNTVVEEILEGTASVSITSNPRKEDVETTGPNYLIKSNKSNNVIPTRMVNTEKCKRDCSQLRDPRDDNSNGFWLSTFSKNRGITISLTVFLTLLVASLIGHLVLSVFRCVIGKYNFSSLNQSSV